MIKDQQTRKSILIVEDDVELADSMTTFLNKAGYFTLSANTVTDAIKKLENQKFHLVVVDLLLGDQTGEKVIHVIRKDLCGLNIRTPIMICSGQLRPKVLSNIKHLIDDAIIKPFNLLDLLTKANHWTNILSKKDPTKTMHTDNKMQILVIDDNTELTDNICAFLNQDETFNAIPCYNILDTTLKITRQKFDCILMDRHLKSKESTEVIKSLRSDKSSLNHKTPVIVITGDLTETFINELRDDVQGFVRKPLAMRELTHVIYFVVSSESHSVIND